MAKKKKSKGKKPANNQKDVSRTNISSEYRTPVDIAGEVTSSEVVDSTPSPEKIRANVTASSDDSLTSSNVCTATTEELVVVVDGAMEDRRFEDDEPLCKWGVLPDIESSDDEEEDIGLETRKDDDVTCEGSLLVGGAQVKEQAGATVLASDSDSDSGDDYDVISPYITKKRTETAITENLSNCNISTSSKEDNSSSGKKTTPTQKQKNKIIIPAKISIDEDTYNASDRGITSGNMYMQLVKKEDCDKGKGAELDAEMGVFSAGSSVSSRLASVKGDLESRVIESRRAKEAEDRQLLERRASSASVEWSYMRKAREMEDTATEKSCEEESAGATKGWAPKTLTLSDSDSDSDSSSSSDNDGDGDDDVIVPRRYGVVGDDGAGIVLAD